MAKISDRYARIIHKGHEGDRVKEIQRILNGLGAKLTIDGDFGGKTASAVVAFQRDHRINDDGIVTRKTAEALSTSVAPGPSRILFSGGLADIFPPAKIFETSPFPVRGQAGAIALLGDPFIPGWDEEYLTRIQLPPELFKNPPATARTTVAHIYAAENFKTAIRLMIAAGLKFNTFDGILNKRKKRGGSSLSTHAWAVAADFDAALNPMGATPKLAPEIVAVWKRAGFLWGGEWRSPDGMHVQRVVGI